MYISWQFNTCKCNQSFESPKSVFLYCNIMKVRGQWRTAGGFGFLEPWSCHISIQCVVDQSLILRKLFFFFNSYNNFITNQSVLWYFLHSSAQEAYTLYMKDCGSTAALQQQPHTSLHFSKLKVGGHSFEQGVLDVFPL